MRHVAGKVPFFRQKSTKKCLFENIAPALKFASDTPANNDYYLPTFRKQKSYILCENELKT